MQVESPMEISSGFGGEDSNSQSISLEARYLYLLVFSP